MDHGGSDWGQMIFPASPVMINFDYYLKSAYLKITSKRIHNLVFYNESCIINVDCFGCVVGIDFFRFDKVSLEDINKKYRIIASKRKTMAGFGDVLGFCENRINKKVLIFNNWREDIIIYRDGSFVKVPIVLR